MISLQAFDVRSQISDFSDINLPIALDAPNFLLKEFNQSVLVSHAAFSSGGERGHEIEMIRMSD
jgi:hypothetical protein